MIITDKNYRELIVQHITDSLQHVKTTQIVRDHLNNFIAWHMSIQRDEVYEVSGNDIQLSAGLELKEYLDALSKDYQKQYADANFIERVLYTKHFKGYRDSLEQMKSTLGELCLKN